MFKEATEHLSFSHFEALLKMHVGLALQVVPEAKLSHGSVLHFVVASQRHLGSALHPVSSALAIHESLMQCYPFQKQLLFPAHVPELPKNEQASVAHFVVASQRHLASVPHGASVT